MNILRLPAVGAHVALVAAQKNVSLWVSLVVKLTVWEFTASVALLAYHTFDFGTALSAKRRINDH